MSDHTVVPKRLSAEDKARLLLLLRAATSDPEVRELYFKLRCHFLAEDLGYE